MQTQPLQIFNNTDLSLSAADYWRSAKIAGIILYTYVKVKAMDSDKVTTITQIIKSASLILGLVGVNVSPENWQTITTGAIGIYAIFGMVQGWFTNKK